MHFDFAMALRVGIDVGGTNTDAAVVTSDGQVLGWAKRATTDENVLVGAQEALQDALQDASAGTPLASGAVVATCAPRVRQQCLVSDPVLFFHNFNFPTCRPRDGRGGDAGHHSVCERLHPAARPGPRGGATAVRSGNPGTWPTAMSRCKQAYGTHPMPGQL